MNALWTKRPIFHDVVIRRSYIFTKSLLFGSSYKTLELLKIHNHNFTHRCLQHHKICENFVRLNTLCNCNYGNYNYTTSIIV